MSELRSLLAVRETAQDFSSEHSHLVNGARDALDRAMGVIDVDAHRRGLTASHVTTAQLHVNAGRSLWLRTLSPQELQSHLPGMFATVKEHLAADDERRTAVEQIERDLRAAGDAGRPAEMSDHRLVTIIEAVDEARQAGLREKLRAESFVRIVRWVTVGLFVLAFAVALASAIWERTVPLCFNPPPTPPMEGDLSVVCPTASARSVPADDLARATGGLVGRGDYIVVEFVGLTAAGIAAASALRKMRGTATAFGIPVALAVLKLPTGALTAVLGLLLMRGAFIPGLSALDSSAQIIAWAVVLGYSQELFTKFVDRQGHAVLEGVRGPTAPKPAPAGPAH